MSFIILLSYKQSAQYYPHIVVFKHQYHTLILQLSNFNSKNLPIKVSLKDIKMSFKTFFT